MRILDICFSDLHKDPRVYRQLRFLTPEHEVWAAGFSNPEVDGVHYIPIARYARGKLWKYYSAAVLGLRQFDYYYDSRPEIRSAKAKLQDFRWDVIIANDIETLPLAVWLKQRNPGTRLILDAHEFTPEQFEGWEFKFFLSPYFDSFCKRFLPEVDKMFAANPGYAHLYHRRYKIHVTPLTSAPFYVDQKPSEVAPTNIRLVHHGNAAPYRKIENLISLIDLLDNRFSLTLMLVPTSPSYLSSLKRLASGKRVTFHDPVPMPEISKALNPYDIGVIMIPPLNKQMLWQLPNKFFECIQGRLALAIWPSPDMAAYVKRYDLGLCTEDFSLEEMANALNGISVEQIRKFKINAHSCAQTCCAEKNAELLCNAINEFDKKI